MAIKIGGTTVIDDNRNLVNIVSGAGSSLPQWDPSSTPDVTYTTTSTWNKPSSLGSSDWVVFYMVGGGGAAVTGSWSTGGNGASAYVFAAKAGTLPSSITFNIGAGGAGGNHGTTAPDGGDTTATINGRTYKATGGYGGFGNTSNYTSQLNTISQALGSYTVPYDGTSPYDYDGAATKGGQGTKGPSGSAYTTAAAFTGANSVLAGGGGCGSTLASTAGSGGTSTYAGNGGSCNQGTIAGNSGGVPGGGGGSDYSTSSQGGSGGSGSVRIYYV